MPYTIEQKKIISTRVSKLKKKKYFIKIFKIISQNSPDVSFTKNNLGFHLDINMLNEETLTKIVHYLDFVETNTSKITLNSDITKDMSDNEDETPLSNREKRLVKHFKSDHSDSFKTNFLSDTLYDSIQDSNTDY
jgi:hypothetical protein